MNEKESAKLAREIRTTGRAVALELAKEFTRLCKERGAGHLSLPVLMVTCSTLIATFMASANHREAKVTREDALGVADSFRELLKLDTEECFDINDSIKTSGLGDLSQIYKEGIA